MLTLKNWFIVRCHNHNGYKAKGVVYGHTSPRCPDGLFIHTSLLEEVTDCGDKILLKTHNSLYTVFKEDVARDFGNTDIMDGGSQDSLSHCFTELNKENGKALADEVSLIAERKRTDIMKLGEKLGCNMLYLNISADCQYYFDSAVYKDKDGKCMKETHLVHVSMDQDSVILEFSNVRYFPHQNRNLCFYVSLYDMPSEPSEEPMGYLRNSGSMPMRVCFTWGKCIELLPNQEVCVDRKIIDALPDGNLTSTEDLYPAEHVDLRDLRIIQPPEE